MLDQATLVGEQRSPADSTPAPEAELLFKEARRRRRRRVLFMSTSVTVAAGLVAFGLSGGHAAPGHRPVARTPGRVARTRPVPALVTCTPAHLAATVAFNATGTDLGAIRLTNTAAQPCSLSGQPAVAVLDAAGVPLTPPESVFARAGLPPPSAVPRPVTLSPRGALPQAIIEVDWFWCGGPPAGIEFRVQFAGWLSSLTVPGSAISPAGFAPASCANSGGHPLMAVDVVRGLGTDGVIVPSATAKG
jgi:hypothetical protein